jgi:hypothetical protein
LCSEINLAGRTTLGRNGQHLTGSDCREVPAS